MFQLLPCLASVLVAEVYRCPLLQSALAQTEVIQ